MKNKRYLAGPYLFWSISFVVIPLLVVFYYAMTNDEGSITFANLAQITTQENLKALGMSLLLSFVSTAICLLLAYPLAMILSSKNVNQSSFIVLIFILPMWMNFLLRTMAWQTLLEKNGVINSILSFVHLPALEIINTPWAIILGMVYNFLPFMVLPIYNVLIKIDRDVINAARDLGASSSYTFFKNHTATEHPRHHQRHYDGICTGSDNFRYFRSSRRRQDPADRQCHRTVFQAKQQLARRKRTFHGPDGIYHCQHGTGSKI